jgi:hypothetical protein
MRSIPVRVVVCCLAFVVAGPALAWSILDEVTVLDPNLTASLIWEDPDTRILCQTTTDLDLLECNLIDDSFSQFWFGMDAAGNRYGVVGGEDVAGTTFFDIYRRPAGTRGNEHIVRVTKNEELVIGEVTKLQIGGRWEVDVTNGEMILSFWGLCATSACIGAGDNTEHLASVRISGLPKLFDLTVTYEPSGALAFRVPQNPEGLESGDYYDLYAGEISTLPDLSAAQAVDCDVAAGMKPGDPVSVADPLPTPMAGTSRYYLIAVTSGLERRAGRQRTAGVLSGRDATGLPACVGP